MQRIWIFPTLILLLLAVTTLAVPGATRAQHTPSQGEPPTPSPTPPPGLPPTATAVVPPLPPQDEQDDDAIRCFNETGYCIQGAILDYWERNGGLPVFGYPIAPVNIETIDGWSGPVQWFQRDRLEDHGAQGVLAGRLGADLLELQGRPWFTFAPASIAPEDCRYFLETNHSLCEPFLSHWERNGGVERFGYPITEPLIETIGDWTGTVQYFERRRMEHHVLLPGSPILLGLLGEEVLFFDERDTPLAECEEDAAVILPLQAVYEEQLDEALREQLGCPTTRAEVNVRASLQNFEFGVMLWTERSQATNRLIYAIIYPGMEQRIYEDPWREGDPVTPDVNPPPGLHRPRGGFGQVWIRNFDLQAQIGWAVEELERFDRANIQVFEHGTMLELQNTRQVFVFGPDPDDLQIIPQ
jgi:hypothetical protein